MRATRVLLLGLGRFGGGTAAVRYLANRGYRVRVADRAAPETLRESVAALADLRRLEFCLGRDDDFLLDGVDLVVCNPAIPPKHRLLARAATMGIPVTQEVNLFLSAYPGRVVLVTGTNGKSSTATLLARVLRCGGVDTLLGGNIGHSLLDDIDAWHDRQVAVLEISSFQLERVDPSQHRVTGAVFTRVTEDHLDRHRTVAAYHDAKAVAAKMAREFVVREAEDAVVAAMPHNAARTLTYGGAGADLIITAADGNCGGDPDGGRGAELWSHLGGDAGMVLAEAAMAMPGSYHLHNAAAAFAAAHAIARIDRHTAGLAMVQTPPLPHRLQLAAAVDGISIFDNSVSTQVESTLAALTSLRGRVHWVGGGKSKDGRFVEPGRELSSKVATAHLFGAAGPELGREMNDRVTTTVHDALEDALEAAWAESERGDTILFSPAFASFDQFPNFVARADRFAAWVEQIRRGERPPDSRSTSSLADGTGSPG